QSTAIQVPEDDGKDRYRSRLPPFRGGSIADQITLPTQNTEEPSKLLLMDLSGQEARLVKELNIGSATTWSVANNKNFLYDLKTKKLHVLNMNLDASNHPIEEIVKRHSSTIDFIVLNIHPYLPFAILSGGNNGSILINWGNGRDATPHLICKAASQFSISPDGKWVTFKKKNYEEDTEKSFLMPVSEKYPHYLGSPMLLLNDYFNDINFAWTTNPISFVGSIRNEIYRWDLEHRDFPGKGKMSFHDYIVQEDLKKLARERRQGLGDKQK
ncbi:MAG: hypothetical protein PHG20_12630, partial [Geobacteraceae bacterium]|nr:hypothetical protein [Geobacteraceae bacterium]